MGRVGEDEQARRRCKIPKVHPDALCEHEAEYEEAECEDELDMLCERHSRLLREEQETSEGLSSCRSRSVRIDGNMRPRR